MSEQPQPQPSIKFQAIDWSQYNEFPKKKYSPKKTDNDTDDSDVSDIESDNDSVTDSESDDDIGLTNLMKYQSKFKIRIFGRDESHESIYVHVNNFKPYFYVKIPESIEASPRSIGLIIGAIKKNMIGYKLTHKNLDGTTREQTITKTIVNGLVDVQIEDAKDLYGFTRYKEFKFLKLVFLNMQSYKTYEKYLETNTFSIGTSTGTSTSTGNNSRLTTQSKKKFQKPQSQVLNEPVAFKLYESNIEPFIRFMHLQNLNPCGWIEAVKYKELKKIKTNTKHAISVEWNDLRFVENNTIQKFIIMSFDIECMSGDGSFPQAKRDSDKIIQIGSSLTYYGESEPFYKSILSLGSCEKVKGMEDVDIKCFDTEPQLLMAWRNLIIEKDPDIFTGWNIVGFDFPYIKERAEKFKILEEFSKISRLKNEKAQFVEKTLSSSALGDNIYRFFDAHGRIVIDQMKDVQRNDKLDSYKLDFVASHFIKEKIMLCEQTETHSIIYTDGVYGIKTEDYIHITWDDGLSMNTCDIKPQIIQMEKLNDVQIAEMCNIIGKYKRITNYEFKKPKTLYKLVLDKRIPDEIFENDNEELWHNIKYRLESCNGESNKIKLFFKIKSRAVERSEAETDENVGLKWTDMNFSKMKRSIKGNEVYWTHAKDDMGPNKMFELYKGDGYDRGLIAKYCMMDCILVSKLLEKLKVLNNNIGMSNVCSVPLSYIFMRGQSVKIFSLVSKKCREMGFIVPKHKRTDDANDVEDMDDYGIGFKKIRLAKHDSEGNTDEEDDESESEDEDDEMGAKFKTLKKKKITYEGATVFNPFEGIHYEPIPVLDYASLYPRSMIFINISHECFVNDMKYWQGASDPDYTYQTVTYNNSDGTTSTCIFAKKKDGKTIGVLCQILVELLDKRSKMKKLMEKAYSEGNTFLGAIYNSLQLAYKVTANSLYGQMGAPTSPIYLKELAASTTATGRKMLEYSRDFIQLPFKELINSAIESRELYYEKANEIFNGRYEKFTSKPEYRNVYSSEIITDEKFNEPKKGRYTKMDFINYFYETIQKLFSSNYRVNPVVIYGDTDSVFFTVKITNVETGEIKKDRSALRVSIEIGKLAGDTICKLLPDPEEQVYEKTLWPFIILTKKRYVGNLYEDDDSHFKQKNMGLALKRRDFAKIVKIMVGGIVNYLLNGVKDETNINDRNNGAIEYTRQMIKKILSGKYSIDKFIISKTLKGYYKDRKTIMHAVLADRIGVRDPGNKPEVNDRVPYVFIITKQKIKLQGDRIENPDYIIQNNLEIDYLFYITNQIMNPTIQFLEHIMEKPESLFEQYINKEIIRRKSMSEVYKYVDQCTVEQVLECGTVDGVHLMETEEEVCTSTKKGKKKNQEPKSERLIEKLVIGNKKGFSVNI